MGWGGGRMHRSLSACVLQLLWIQTCLNHPAIPSMGLCASLGGTSTCCPDIVFCKRYSKHVWFSLKPDYNTTRGVGRIDDSDNSQARFDFLIASNLLARMGTRKHAFFYKRSTHAARDRDGAYGCNAIHSHTLHACGSNRVSASCTKGSPTTMQQTRTHTHLRKYAKRISPAFFFLEFS